MEQQKKVTSNLAIAAMVCGIISIIPMGGVSLILGIIAIVLGLIAKNDCLNNKKEGLKFAKTGIICGIIAVVLWVILLAILGGTLLSYMS